MTEPTTPVAALGPAPPPEATSLVRRTGVGMLWAQAAKMVEVGLTFAIAVLAIRALQPVRFGEYSVITNLAGVGSILLPIATTEAMGALLPHFRRRGERVFLLLAVLLGRGGLIVIGMAALVLCWPSVHGLFGLAGVGAGVAVIGGTYWLALDALNTVAGWFVAEIAVRTAAVARVVGQLVTLVALAFVVGTGAASVGRVVACAAGGYAVAAVSLIAGIRWRPVRPQAQQLRSVVTFSRNVWLAGVLTLVLATQADVLLIGALTKQPRQVAYYAAAVGVVTRIQLVLLAGWTSLVIPALGHARVNGGEAAFLRGWRLFAKLSLLTTLPVNVLLIVLARPLTTVVAGASYQPAAGLLRWVAAFNIAAALVGGTLGVSALWVVDRTGAVVRVRIATALVNLALAIVLILHWHALGAAVATGIAAVLTSGSELLLARRYARVNFPARFAVDVCVACAAAAAPALFLRPAGAGGMAVAAALGVTLFAAVLSVIRTFEQGDVEFLAEVSERLAASPLARLARP